MVLDLKQGSHSADGSPTGGEDMELSTVSITHESLEVNTTSTDSDSFQFDIDPHRQVESFFDGGDDSTSFSLPQKTTRIQPKLFNLCDDDFLGGSSDDASKMSVPAEKPGMVTYYEEAFNHETGTLKSLDAVCYEIANPSERVRETIGRVREIVTRMEAADAAGATAEAERLEKESKAVKKTLPAFSSTLFHPAADGTPGIRKGHNMNAAWHQTFDADHLKTLAEAERIRDEVFDSEPFVVAAFVSPSGRGVKFVTTLSEPVKDEREFKRVYALISGELSRRHGLTFDSTSDPARLCFHSFDPDMRSRDDDRPYHAPAPETPPEGGQPCRPAVEPSEEDEERTATALTALAVLSPKRAEDYNSWVSVGMALKASGADVESWIDWCSDGALDHEDLCLSKWESFGSKDSGGGLSVASLCYWADEDTPGWRSTLPRFNWDGIGDVRQGDAHDDRSLLGGEMDYAKIFSKSEDAKIMLFDRTDRYWMLYDRGIWVPHPNPRSMVEAHIRALLKTKLWDASEQLKLLQEKEADKGAVAEQKKRVERIAAKIESVSKRTTLDNILSLLGEHRGCDHVDFESKPNLYCMANGTFDFATMSFRPHSPDDMLLNKADFDYESKATCPTFIKFLHDMFLGDQVLIDWVLNKMAVSLTGFTPHEELLFLHGLGSNGKSSLVRILQMLLGSYAATLNVSALTQSHAGFKPSDSAYIIAGLYGKRAVFSTETEKGAKLSASLVKQLTGNDTLSGRHPAGRPFDFRPQHKLWISGNYRPRLDGLDFAIWRRVKLVPFLAKFPKGDANRFDEIYKSELPGIFNLVASKYAARPPEPPCVSAATEEYKRESDPLAPWLTARTKEKAGGCLSLAAVFSDYRAWMAEQGDEGAAVKTSRNFADMLRLHGFEVKNGTGNVTSVYGLWIKQSPSDAFGFNR